MKKTQPERLALTPAEQDAIAGQDALIESLMAILAANYPFAGEYGETLMLGLTALHHTNRKQLKRLRA